MLTTNTIFFTGLAALSMLNPHCHCSQIFEAVLLIFGGPNFYNLVIEHHTKLTFEGSKVILRKIKPQCGSEPKRVRCRDRTLDIDLLTYGDAMRS
ncbi:2-amino-4-hydroxy-6-hydroxymethyldihydropteridine diphosphokinase [Candidatus Enterovibrio altilux]|uniref:2-amino-4-hydroxy-6- hydroxymethyldihydropteridine diphosphokinase n=1 Tax=Candidatus Enterovibrio altilux TaxID=1927128 RepID=UPI000BBCDA62|nr:2-amino-4-hydroxy-6-hydroxymethyldihydropteridine diphosphokinase [Candidatus Enterovibrio luxaltus]